LTVPAVPSKMAVSLLALFQATCGETPASQLRVIVFQVPASPPLALLPLLPISAVRRPTIAFRLLPAGRQEEQNDTQPVAPDQV